MLFLTIGTFPGVTHRGIYTDLLREFRDRGHEVYVVRARERREGGRTDLICEDGIHVLGVRTGNLTKSGFLEKAVSTLLVERQFKSAVDRFLSKVHFDLVMYSTPPVTLDRVVGHVKRRDGCVSYLLLKDIFPQNAVDLGIMARGGLAWRFFRSRERRLYRVSDWIGCMSEANVDYVRDHNKQVPPGKLEVCANSIDPLPVSSFRGQGHKTRAEMGVPEDRLVLLYGGNLGHPQGVSFILECLKAIAARRDVFLMIVGSGTEYSRIAHYLEESGQANVLLRDAVSRDEYDALLGMSDVGLIFLDSRFTVPNFPSRLTSYMEAGLPVLAATDSATDLRTVLEESGCGVWVPSDDVNAFIEALKLLSGDADLRRRMGKAGRSYLEGHYTVAEAFETIVGHLRGPHCP